MAETSDITGDDLPEGVIEPAAATPRGASPLQPVPFGKYKGRPALELAADRAYCEWLTAQPWFSERYRDVYNVVINYGAEPTETPEHNALQARFLDDAFCLAVADVLQPGGARGAMERDEDKRNERWREDVLRAEEIVAKARLLRLKRIQDEIAAAEGWQAMTEKERIDRPYYNPPA